MLQRQQQIMCCCNGCSLIRQMQYANIDSSNRQINAMQNGKCNVAGGNNLNAARLQMLNVQRRQQQRLNGLATSAASAALPVQPAAAAAAQYGGA